MSPSDPKVDAPRPLTRRLAFIAMMVALLVGFGLLILEVGARLLDPQGISYYPNTALFMDTMVLEQPIGYRNRPGLSGTFYNQPVSINSIGLRHRELAVAPDPSKYRILMLGDSVVFGVGVADEDTLPRQLEAILRQEMGEIDGRQVEVINMGVISYNTEQELIQYEEIGAKLEPDLVLLMFSDNDIEPKMWIFSKRSNPLVAIGQRSYAVSLAFVLKREWRNFVRGPQPLIQRSSFREGHPRWQSIDASLSAINRLTAAADVPFVLFTRGDKGDAWEMLSKVAKREGFPLLVLKPFEDDRWKHLDRKDFRAKGAGGHLNAEGLAMYATLIHEQVEALGLLGRRRSRLVPR